MVKQIHLKSRVKEAMCYHCILTLFHIISHGFCITKILRHQIFMEIFQFTTSQYKFFTSPGTALPWSGLRSIQCNHRNTWHKKRIDLGWDASQTLIHTEGKFIVAILVIVSSRCIMYITKYLRHSSFHHDIPSYNYNFQYSFVPACCSNLI